MNPDLLTNLPPELRAPIEKEWERIEQERKASEAKAEAIATNERKLMLQIKLLSEEIRLLRIEKFGAKSEQLTDGQLELLDCEPSVTAAEVEAEAERSPAEKQQVERQRGKDHPGRNALPDHLPRRENLLVCTPEQCICKQCGAEKAVIGYDTSEEFDVEPAVHFVKVTKREKRACKKCEELGVSMAPITEPKIVEKSKLSNRLIVEMIISKYLYQIPIFRQSAKLNNDAGVDLSRSTMCGLVISSGELLKALIPALKKELFEPGYIQADETPVGVQSDRTKGENHQAYFWEYSRPGGPVIFDFQMGRSREGPKKFLGDYGGVLQTDGYAAYDRIGGEGITFAGCWAHARRGFVNALKIAPQDADAQAILAEIAKLYAVEKQAREGELIHEARGALRAAQSVPILSALKDKILEVRRRALPKSVIGKACDYALGQWPRLLAYASHGAVEIDNNWCENAIRPIALGRKNWLHIGSEPAGECVAAIISIVETCRRLKIDVREYLLDVLPRIAGWPAKRIGELTPSAWAAARPKK